MQDFLRARYKIQEGRPYKARRGWSDLHPVSKAPERPPAYKIKPVPFKDWGGTRTVQNNTKTKNTLSDRSYLPLRELFAEDGRSIPGQSTKMLDSGRVQPRGGESHRHWQNKSNAEAAISMRILLSICEWATESLEASRTLRAPSRLKHPFKGHNRKLRITASILLLDSARAPLAWHNSLHFPVVPTTFTKEAVPLAWVVIGLFVKD